MLASGDPGRNDSCPCGSGAKYKRCCLVHQQEFARDAPELEDAIDGLSLEARLRRRDGYLSAISRFYDGG